MTNLRFAFLFTAAACLTAIHPIAQSPGPMAVPTKFDTASDHLLIRVDVNGASLWCNLDTGYSALVAIDRAKAVASGIIEGAGRPTPDGRAADRGDGGVTARLTIGRVVFSNQPMIVRDLPDDVPDMDCIIGAALLREYIIEFEHTKPQVTLQERSAYSPPAGAVLVPLIFRTNPSVPFVHVSLELPDGTRQELQTVVDTGAAYYALALVPPAAGRARERLTVARRPTDAVAGNNPVQLLAARPKAVSVGPFTIEQPVIALIESNIGAVDDGVLGSGFLNRFTIGFDFVGRQMYLLPNSHPLKGQPFDASGVGFRIVGSVYEVDVVLPGTPASQSGLRVGDTLLTIDGVPVGSLTLEQLRDRLSRPGERCLMRMRRAGQPIEVILVLETRL